MKKINKIALFLLGASIIFLAGACTEDFEEMNTDPAILNEEMVDVNLLLTNLEVSGFVNNAYTGAGMYGQLCGMSKRDDSPPFHDNDSPGIWNTGYENLINSASNIIQLIDKKEDKAELVNKTAIARIIKAWSVAYVTDTYGDMPYSESCLPKEQVVLQPKYDTQKDIYTDLFKELKEAAGQLNESKASYGNADLVFKGNPAKWKKLANSIRLRMALRVYYADPALAQAQLSDLSESNLITAVADEGYVAFCNDKTSHLNPRYQPLVMYGGVDEAVRAHKTMIDIMLNDGVHLDPRIGLYADTVTATFKGGISPNGYNAPKWLYRGSPTLGRVEAIYEYPWAKGTTSLLCPFWRVPVMKATTIIKSSEVYFLLAEAKLRGILPANFTGSANDYYQKGIDKSIEWYQDFYDRCAPQIGPLMKSYLNKSWTDNNVNQYLEHKRIKNTDITAFKATPVYTLSGSFEGKLEMIINQKIVALYPDEFQGWCEYRRTGYPKIAIGPDSNALKGIVPRRESWPTREETINTKSYAEAFARYGADSRKTRFWWDANPTAPHVYDWVAPSMPTAW